MIFHSQNSCLQTLPCSSGDWKWLCLEFGPFYSIIFQRTEVRLNVLQLPGPSFLPFYRCAVQFLFLVRLPIVCSKCLTQHFPGLATPTSATCHQCIALTGSCIQPQTPSPSSLYFTNFCIFTNLFITFLILVSISQLLALHVFQLSRKPDRNLLCTSISYAQDFAWQEIYFIDFLALGNSSMTGKTPFWRSILPPILSSKSLLIGLSIRSLFSHI